MKRIAVVLIGLAAVLFSPAAPPAGACSCVMQDRNAHIEAAQFVFTGVARTIANAADRLTATFEVTSVFKGDVPARATVATDPRTESCGTPFRKDIGYAIFARGSGQVMITNLCSGTTEDLSVLSGVPGHPPSRVSASGSTCDCGRSRTIAITIAAILLGFVVTATMTTRRGRLRRRRFA